MDDLKKKGAVDRSQMHEAWEVDYWLERAWRFERRTGKGDQKGWQFNCRGSKRIGFARDVSLKRAARGRHCLA
jgi:hypothetical protein